MCSAHCVICPREQYKQKLRSMEMGLFKKIIDDAAQYEIESIDTCGFGECFMDKHLFERFEYIRKNIPGCEIFVSSTAFYMDESKWDAVAQYIDILKLSIYGTTKETYEAFHRGNIKYEIAMDNIFGFIEYAKSLIISPRIVGLFVETKSNWYERDKWLDIWEPKLDEVMVWKPHNWVDGRSYRTVDKTRQISCGRPFNAPLYVQTDGIVVPCCWDIHQRIPLGDMKTQTIEEVYRGGPYMDLRRAHELGNFDKYICGECDQTNHNPGSLIYSSNKNRQVGMLTSNESTIKVS